MKKHTLFPLLISALIVGSFSNAFAGPTPYPDPKDQAAWPGKGPIRWFKWMDDNRKAYWARRESDQGAFVFAGDSNTMGWKTQLKEYFPDMKSANRGIGGDTSRGLLFRFQEDVVDLNPKGIVILIGGNDLSAHGAPKFTISNIEEMIQLAYAKNPQVPIVLCKTLPKNDPKAPGVPGAKEELNAEIAKLQEKYPTLTVLDTYTPFLGADGELNPSYYKDDGTHLVPEGYKKFAQVLKPVLVKLGWSNGAAVPE